VDTIVSNKKPFYLVRFTIAIHHKTHPHGGFDMANKLAGQSVRIIFFAPALCKILAVILANSVLFRMSCLLGVYRTKGTVLIFKERINGDTTPFMWLIIGED
jgi:hypothetical protein